MTHDTRSTAETGPRIRRLRRQRGLSLDVVAGLAGVSKGYLSRLERGERRLDSLSLLTRIAAALQVSPEEIDGAGGPASRRGDAVGDEPLFADALDAVRLALLEPDRPGPRELGEIIDGFVRLSVLTRACDLTGQARIVPGLLAATQRRAAVRPSVLGLQGVVLAAFAASELARNLGAPDLSWAAAQRMRRAADDLDDPAWTGFAATAEAQALWPLTAWRTAVTTADAAATAITTHGRRSVAHRDAVAARGSCLLAAGFAASTGGDLAGARARLDEAAGLAAQDHRGAVATRTSFSSTNVALYRLAVEVESGDPGRGLCAVQGLDLTTVPTQERLSYHWTDTARAWTRLGRPHQALAAYRCAERAAPTLVRSSAVVRTGVASLLAQGRAASSEAELRALARRCGVPQA